MLNNIKNTIYARLYAAIDFFVNGWGVTILMYHRVNDALAPSDLSVSLRKFEEQMRYLKRFCQVVRLEDLLDTYANKRELPRRRKPQVIITLDDGYRDNYLNAFPVLKKLGLPATIFLATGFIGKDKKIGRYQHMPSPDMLSWQEVETMRDNVTFCPHTENHPHLPELSPVEQKEEIRKSMDALAAHLSAERTPKIFAYPYGQHNESTLKILHELGIKVALTTQRGLNTGHEDPLLLKRVSANGNDGLRDFIKKVSPVCWALKWRWELLTRPMGRYPRPKGVDISKAR